MRPLTRPPQHGQAARPGRPPQSHTIRRPRIGHQLTYRPLREDGLLIWAGTEHEDLYCWRADGDDPDRWPVVVRSFDGEDVPFDCQTAEFVCRILVDPHHPFTMARYFDTHWFMNYRKSD
ncbi:MULTISPECIES: hypothetical protein [unclassified Streptomyces]|uniref:hypothetical protein n=1 Tax=unclassified Streptomyces TaxID=2593676 RepID=UPI000A9C6097|nr:MULTISPECIES: hypothetical protein [unclassified Streptomyces]